MPALVAAATICPIVSPGTSGTGVAAPLVSCILPLRPSNAGPPARGSLFLTWMKRLFTALSPETTLPTDSLPPPCLTPAMLPSASCSWSSEGLHSLLIRALHCLVVQPLLAGQLLCVGTLQPQLLLQVLHRPEHPQPGACLSHSRTGADPRPAAALAAAARGSTSRLKCIDISLSLPVTGPLPLAAGTGVSGSQARAAACLASDVAACPAATAGPADSMAGTV
jgi:hypothetical protein